MRRCGLLSVLVLAFLSLIPTAKADTIYFTATITRQFGLSVVPIGSTYTGSIHYPGSIDPNFTGTPPIPDSYTFNYPSAPDSLSDFKWAFLQRHYIGGPLFAGLMYVDFSDPVASFNLIGDGFFIFTPTYEDIKMVDWTVYEYGDVSYTYASDFPIPSTVPEPSSLLLIATGIVSAAGMRKRFAS